MKTVITILYGNKYSVEDVHYIYEKTKEYRHVCLVDKQNSKLLNKKIQQIRIEEPEGHWEKIKLFKNDWEGDCLYLDLDVIIQGSLDKLFEYGNKPTICYTYWKSPNHVTEDHRYRLGQDYFGEGDVTDPLKQKWKGMYNSSVMVWKDNEARYIYEHFENNDQYYMTKYCGDDRFLYHEKLFDQTFPKGLIYSWEYGVDFDTDISPRGYQIKPDYPIVLLNGHKPKEELRKKYYDALSLHKVG